MSTSTPVAPAPVITEPMSRHVVKVGLVSPRLREEPCRFRIMAGHLHKAGMALTPNADEADVMIVNTCSFIDAAKEESIGAILETNQNRGMRRRHQAQKLIVAGCMAQRFAGELKIPPSRKSTPSSASTN